MTAVHAPAQHPRYSPPPARWPVAVGEARLAPAMSSASTAGPGSTLDETTNVESLFVSNLPMIERIIAAQGRRHSMTSADREDYASWAKARLIDHDYAVLRKFAGRSSLQTYLTAVLVNLFRDYRNAAWGRWRPSAAAKRLGPDAIRVEELVFRQGHSVREVCQILASAGRALHESDVARLVARLPARAAVREISIDETERVEGRIPDRTSAMQSDDLTDAIHAAIRSMLDDLPPEDALIVRMKFWDDISVADIARTLGLQQKALYRRLDALQLRLRTRLEERGIDRAAALEVLDGAST